MRLPDFLRRPLLATARRIMNHYKPSEVIRRDGQPEYMLRWCLLPKNPLGNIYLHFILQPDMDEHLHDHPWPSLGLILDGCYIETIGDELGFPVRQVTRNRGDIIARSATQCHRIARLPEAAAITIMLIGPRQRSWGFWRTKGPTSRWVHQRDYFRAKEQ